MNSFHWHITDSQSWPLHVEAFPELAVAGAYSPESIYSKQDVQEIIVYAGAVSLDLRLSILRVEVSRFA